MNYMWCLLLIHTTWMANTLALYHEQSMRKFEPVARFQGAMFGYSVTYVPSNAMLIVGAPKAKATGEVYICHVRGTGNYCTAVPHDIHAGNATHSFLLGATVKAGSDFYVTCAPRFPGPVTETRKYGTYSLCLYSQNGTLKRMESLADNKKEKNDILERYMDSFGWSIDINDTNHIVIGSPAAAKGRVILYKDHSPHKYPEYISAVNKEVNYNFGYSLSYYKFYNNRDIAIGSPYGRIGYGAVYLSQHKEPVIDNEDKDIPVGSLFAASLCSADLEGKGSSALIVGAPTYARANFYNRGAVFIYSPALLSFRPFRMVLRAKVCGVKDGGYFGNAIAKLGDLNGDKRDDIAISAPYEDDGRGAVYIYSGAELIKKKAEGQIPYLQRIQRENYRSFGLSLSALKDYDNNGCNELAIGVPGNNSVMIFRCMASITVTVAEIVERSISGAKTPGLFGFQSCVEIQYPDLPREIKSGMTESHTTNIAVEIVLIHIHAKFVETTESSSVKSYEIQIEPGEKKPKFCQDLTIQTPSNTSYDPTLQYYITATLLKDQRTIEQFDPSRVLLSNASILSQPGKVWIGDCKNEENCTPKLDLKVESSFQSQYTVGSSNVETLNIIAYNTGNTAYSVAAKINISGVLASKWPKFCTRGSDEEFTCKYPALLRNGTSWETGNIEFETKNLISDALNPETKITITVNLYDEFSKVKVEQWNQVVKLISSSENVTIQGMTKNGDIVNVTIYEARTAGAHIDHVYSIINNGMTTWGNVNATITLSKKVFLSDGSNVNGGDNYVCSEFTTTDKEYKVVCLIKRLENKFEIIVSIDLLSGDLEDILRQENTTVFSTLQFELNGDVKKHSITSTLVLYEALVPTWIIVAAALVGLLLLVILAFAMHECGFLRRKNKEKLQELKRDVRRQTIRRSMMIQHGSTGDDQNDRKRLIDTSENDETTNNANIIDSSESDKTTNNKNSLTTVAEITPPKSTLQKPDILPKPKLKTVHENVDDDRGTDIKTETQPTKVEMKKDPRVEKIIGELQKNLRKQ